MAEKYNIAFYGQVIISADVEQVKKKIQHILKLSDAQLLSFFSGKKIIIKKSLPIEEASSIKTKLEQHGLIIELEKVPSSTGLSPANQPITNLSMERNYKPKEATEKKAPRKRYEDYFNDPIEAPIPETFGFHCDGRFGRLNFVNAQSRLLLIIIPLVAAYFAVLEASPSGVLSQFILITICVIYINFSYRVIVLRLHDLDLSGWLVFVFALFKVPYIGVIAVTLFALYLIFMPGSKEMNRFGPPSQQGTTTGGFAFAILAPILISSIAYIDSQNDNKRKMIEESIALTEQLQRNIQTYYANNKKLPTEISSLETPSIPQDSNIIQGAELTKDGEILIHYHLKIQKEGYLTIAPTINGDIVMWRCDNSNLNNKILPHQCRTQIENLVADNSI